MQPQRRFTPSGGDQSGGYPEILPVDAATTKPPEERKKRRKANGEAPPSSMKPMFSIGSPPREKQTDDRSPGVGALEFLKNCSLCKKLLSDENPIHMYGYLCAFCSLECRQHRMDMDKFDPSTSTDANFPSLVHR